jgi:hypothetical protein
LVFSTIVERTSTQLIGAKITPAQIRWHPVIKPPMNKPPAPLVRHLVWEVVYSCLCQESGAQRRVKRPALA